MFTMARFVERERERERERPPLAGMPGVGPDSPHKPEPSAAPRGRGAAPAGSRRAASPWRRPALLPVLALLLGALGLFAAAPAQAQTTVWSATLTVGKDGIYYGCEIAATQVPCSSALTDDDFEYNGRTYHIRRLSHISSTNRFQMSTDPTPRAKLAGLVLHLGNTRLALGDFGAGGRYQWDNVNPQWSDGQQVAVKLTVPSLGRAGSMSVDGFHPMGPGRMKIAEGTSITYGIVIHQPPTLDLTITPRHHNVRPDGSDYPNVDNSLLTIHNAVTWKAAPHPNYLSGDWQRSKSVGLTAVDDNECKSPPGTRYWIRHHGSGGGPDWGGWDRQDRHHGLVISIEIIDDDCKYLAASPGQVYPEEGGSATYTVRLKTPLEDAAYISPRISVPGDSDPGAITVSPERIRVEAGDTSPKTFTVSAGRDANSRNEVLIVDHSVDSPEVPADYLGGRVTVIVQDEQNAARTHERDALSVTGLALTAGSEAVALSPAFSTDVTSYRAEVPAGTAGVTLAPHWSGGASVHAGSRRGGTTFTRPARVRPSGTAVALALAPDGGATELWVMASGGSGGMTTYRIEVTEAQAQAQVPEEQTPPEEEAQTVAVAFGKVPAEHDGRTAFALDVQSGSEPAPDAFKVTAGTVTGVESLDPVLWRVRVMPKSWKDVKIALGGASAKVPGPARIRAQDARAKEGKDASLDFAVTLHRAASHEVSVDYATKDGTATAGADYTATSGTLTFAAGETAKTVSVAILDDAIDEGKETFTLKLSNPRGAYLRKIHREATGVIKNDDPLQQAWLARFGRTVATHVTDAVGDRLRGGPGSASHLTLGGYRVPLGRAAASQPAPPGAATRDAGTGAAPNEAVTTTAVLTEVARMLGIGPGAGPQPTPWADRPDPRLNPGRTLEIGQTLTLRRLLMGSAFRLNLGATDADAATPRLTAWGRVAGTTFDGQAGDLSLNGDVFTGTVGVDGTWDRLVLGLAVAHSRGDGGFTQPNLAERGTGDLEQTLTSLHPYLRYAVTDRLDVWGLVGYGWGEWDLEMANGVTVETDTTLVMGAFGGRGILLAPADTGGFQLATRTDAMLTRTSSDAVANSVATDADAHRLRVLLEGSRGVTWADGRHLTPTVELGVRHDWGDAETGFGLEVGGRVSYADPTLGLTVEGTVRGLVAHEADAYQEWGASGSVRLDPGAAGRGLSVTLAPTWGAAASGVDGLWARQTTQGLAPATQSAPRGRLAADVGYGFAAFGAGLITPYAGTVLSDGADRTYRVGTRVRMTGRRATGLTLNLEGAHQEPAGQQPVNQGLRLQVEWQF